MPPRIPKACRKQGCPKTTIDQSGFCAEHKPIETSWTKYHNGKDRHERGYGTKWTKLREQVLRRDRYLCQCEECKRYKFIKPATEVDHITAKAHGGTDELSNLQAINKECHKRKTARERLNGRGS